jgi:hypothetical protein
MTPALGRDHTESLPAAHGFLGYWGYLYHLDTMQGVSFPDFNKTVLQQTAVPPCKNTPVPGLQHPGAAQSGTALCQMPTLVDIAGGPKGDE